MGHSLSFNVIYQSNQGPSAAKNTGWKECRGDWIQFLDADDIIEPEKIQLQVNSEHASDPEIACLYSCWRDCYVATDHLSGAVKDCKEEARIPRLEIDLLTALIETEGFIPFGSALVRRRWLEAANGFDEMARFIEDVDLWLRIAIIGGRFGYVHASKPQFTYRRRDDSLSNSNRLEFMRGCVRNARLVELHSKIDSAGIEARLHSMHLRHVLTNIYESALPVFARADQSSFEQLLEWVYKLHPQFRPSNPSVRHASLAVGTRNAFRLQAFWWQIRSLLKNKAK